ncbi:MAG: leucine dehydrogenase [Candidatus Eisenbacteria bacterium]|nr:leucine dehydrogenase [Candidatus Eisenbacteria bacterium]
MNIFDRMKKRGHEQLIFCFNRPTGLKAIIAIHDTTLGTSVGGTRLMQYESEDQAIVDALRLSEMMTLESASLESDMGGGKAVLMVEEDDEPDEAYFRAFGRFVEGLKGMFVTYPAFGTSDREFRYVRRETSSVIPMEGNHELTAFGVMSGMKACMRELTGHSTLKGVHVAVQGVGKVGQFLVDELVEEGATVTVTDVRYDQIKAVQDRHEGVQVARPDEILGVECDILSPCAVGRILNDATIPRLRCRIVAGPASDTLEEPRHADLLHERGILFAPDFVIGGAELFQTEPELSGAPRERLRAEAGRVYDAMADIITEAKKEETTPYRIAVERAARRVGKIGMVRNIMC